MNTYTDTIQKLLRRITELERRLSTIDGQEFSAGASGVPSFSADKSGSNQTIAAITWTLVSNLTETRDTDDAFASGRYTAKKAGMYLIIAQINWQPAVVGAAYYVGLALNGTINGGGLMYGANTSRALSTGIWLKPLAVGDYLDMYAYSDAAGGATIIANAVTYFSGVMFAGT